MSVDLAQALAASAQRNGADPLDLGTVISYETAGTFDPWKAGPTTQWGQHRGLIQWGEPQRAQYGVTQGMPVADQMRAVEKYLVNAGFKPGMGLLDMYSAVNAGSVGRYNASDVNNGGAPGTVRDKVMDQMAGHREKAAALLGLTGGVPPANLGGQPMAPPPGLAGIVDMFGAPPVRDMTPAFAPPGGGSAQAPAVAARPQLDRARREALLADAGSWFLDSARPR